MRTTMLDKITRALIHEETFGDRVGNFPVPPFIERGELGSYRERVIKSANRLDRDAILAAVDNYEQTFYPSGSKEAL